ncbi:unnamed protein product, partial [Mesorhabditis belari]|uniref:Uncharacterized protein n=1 Tax=Mesorhabditis belari TaxID=2138241 RepID=A0AAF3FCA2_9BILA
MVLITQIISYVANFVTAVVLVWVTQLLARNRRYHPNYRGYCWYLHGDLDGFYASDHTSDNVLCDNKNESRVERSASGRYIVEDRLSLPYLLHMFGGESRRKVVARRMGSASRFERVDSG